MVLHCGIVYESILEGSWIVVDPKKADWIGLIRMYLDIFVMCTLFFIAGFFMVHSYKKGSITSLIKSKLNRIMLPWLVGVLTMIPLYKYIFLYSRGLPQESWNTYFHIFSRPGGDPYFFADNPVMNWLWFLPVLFVFQMLYIFIKKVGIKFSSLSLKTFLWSVFFLGLAYSMTSSGLGFKGWYHSAVLHFQQERLLVYFLVFLLGAYIHEQNIMDDILKKKRWYLYTNILLTISLTIFTITALNLFFNMVDPSRNFYFITPGADRTLYYFSFLFSMLSFIYILLYAFKSYINQSGKLFLVLASNSYFVYIIHVVVLGIIAIPLLEISIPTSLKYLALSVLTFIVSNLIVWLYRNTLHSYVNNIYFKALIVLIGGFVTFSVYGYQKKLGDGTLSNSSVIENKTVNIHEAVATGDVEALEAYISNKSELNIVEPSGGSTPLITSSLFGQEEAVEMLIEAGAELNAQNNDGSTALHTAALVGRLSIVKKLLESGIDASITNNSGATGFDTVAAPYELVKPIIDYLNDTFSLGLVEKDVIENRKEIVNLMSK